MKTVLVASSKGGVGKTTIATHLAAHAALSGQNTVLIDADPQGSSMRWAGRRASMDSAVLALDGSRRHRAVWKSVPADTARVVVDAAAGAMAADLEVWLDNADAVVVPVLPSTLDIDATVPFLNTLVEHPRVRSGALPVGLVANRLRPWTKASRRALEAIGEWPYPTVAELRDSQAYVVLVGLGRGLFDYHSRKAPMLQAARTPLLRLLTDIGRPLTYMHAL